MAEIDQTERACRAVIYGVAGIGPVRMRLLLKHFGSGKAIWQTAKKGLLAIGLREEVAEEIDRRRKTVDPEAFLTGLAKQGIRILLFEDKEYPKLLKKIDDSPVVLFVRGHFLERDERALAVVGTRKPTPYGRDVSERLVEELVSYGMTIVSGLARGIDGVAHRVALESGGRTIAVLGGGVDRVYPPEHKGLAVEVAQHGAVVSEYAPGTLPLAGNFPARNRLISGLSLGVLVVEGAAKSGTKITANFALEQGREVFAVPGPITSFQSQAPADLIKSGAKAVTSVSDILEELRLEQFEARANKVVTPPQDLSEEERRILEVLGGGSLHVDEIVRTIGLETPAVSARLTMMEIKGLVKHLGGMVYTRK